MFLSESYIKEIGFAYVGKNVQISDKAVFYNPGKISIGDNSRIDDFCILSAGERGIYLGKYVHLACYSCIIGKGKVVMMDYSGLSIRTTVLSSSDSYDGEFMTNPTIAEQQRKTISLTVQLGRHVVVGVGSIVLPGAILKDGCAVGALSLVASGIHHNDSIIAGVPAKFIKERKKNIYELEKQIP